MNVVVVLVLEDVWKHEERVLAAVTECHDSEERILKLEQELASVKSRNIEHISEVEKQLAVVTIFIRIWLFTVLVCPVNHFVHKDFDEDTRISFFAIYAISFQYICFFISF